MLSGRVGKQPAGGLVHAIHMITKLHRPQPRQPGLDGRQHHLERQSFHRDVDEAGRRQRTDELARLVEARPD